MEDDRTLLTQAAKAAGIDGYYHDAHKGILAASFVWNPLVHDGDALRLAVKLNLSLVNYRNDEGGRRTSVKQWHLDEQTFLFEQEEHGDDPYAATRRAIVRAAASLSPVSQGGEE